jgi:peptidoglycan-N-acetylglucosamine deacetylase
MKKPLLFTTSWDDGHPLDSRLAEILARHGCKGTFYVPCRNRDGRPVVSVSELCGIASSYEIGGHTLDHCFLDGVDPAEARRQIVDGKSTLEDRIGAATRGFAYPGGKHNRFLQGIVRDAGYAYGRTIECYCLAPHADPYVMPTTLQVYRHGMVALLKNYLKRGHLMSRAPVLLAALDRGDLLATLLHVLDLAITKGGVLHLWGHSWELESRGLWGTLDAFLAEVAGRIPQSDRVTNFEAFGRAGVAPGAA